MLIQPANIIQYIFVFQALFGVFLIWNNLRYRGLVYLLILAAISMIFNLLEETAGSRDIYLVTPIFLLAKGPYFYLFVFYLVYPERHSNRNYLWHSLPMFLALPFTQWPQTIIGLGSISQLLYAVISFQLIYKYHRATFSNRSDADSLQLDWVIKILASFLALGLFDLIRLNLQPYISMTLNHGGQLFENAAFLLLFCTLVYKALQNPRLFDGLAEFEQSEQQLQDEPPEDISHLQVIYDTLEHMIKAESLHHKARLSLNDLVEKTGINQRDISQAINQVAKISFCDYINRLRIDDIKYYLDENSQSKVNLLELAFDKGFNSKSSFNSAFKRELSMTPSQYIKQIQNAMGHE